MAIPRTDGQLMVWYKNFAERLPTHATALGLTQAEVAAVQADNAMLSYLVGDLVRAYETALQVQAAYKNLIKDGPVGAQGGGLPPGPTLPAAPAVVAPGIVPRLRQTVARIKAAPAYTEAIGADLGIADSAPPPAVPDSSAKPAAKASVLASGQVQVEFSKGRFDGVLIEGRRVGEAEWRGLGTDNYSPFVDARPLQQAGVPEVREYRLRYVLRDEPVGEWSDIISAIAGP